MCKRISINIFLEIPFSKNPHHTETSQPICFAVLTERYFRTDFRPLLTVMSYSQRTYKSNYSDLYISEYVSNSEASIKSFSQNKHLSKSQIIHKGLSEILARFSIKTIIIMKKEKKSLEGEPSTGFLRE